MQCIGIVLAACGISYNPEDIVILREGRDMGRQAVFRVAQTWVVRIFELHDGYRQPAEFVSRVLTDLEKVGAPSERIRHHGVVSNTVFHYTVTDFAAGIPLPKELCAHPVVCSRVATLFRAMRGLYVPDSVGTVEDHMRPRLERLHTKLSSVSPDIIQKVGQLSTLSDFNGYRMVVSHCDLAPENIICRLDSLDPPSVIEDSICVIDWEFSTYVPEFVDGAKLWNKAAKGIWGDRFTETYDLDFRPYSRQVILTERLCMLAEDYEGPEFENSIPTILDTYF
jgi:hypothetical protein